MMVVYRVKDESWLEQMKVGQKIRFVPGLDGDGKTMQRFEIVGCTVLLCD